MDSTMIAFRDIFGGLGNRMFQQAYIYAQARRGEIPDIYIQDEKYFSPYQEEIKALYAQGIDKSDYISLHVRRGDYINNAFYINLQETDYYEKSVALFPGEKFLVFCADRQKGSDDKADMEWCKERFQGPQFEFFQGKDELEDFNKMAGCKGHILANSSFSYWAAYVSGNRTVYPSVWFNSSNMGGIPPPVDKNWTMIQPDARM